MEAGGLAFFGAQTNRGAVYVQLTLSVVSLANGGGCP